MVSHEAYPTTTHPEILKTVITWLQDQGHEIICGDAQGVDVRTKNVQDTAIIRVCREQGIEFLNLYKQPMKRLKSPRGFRLKMSAVPFEADSIISLPNLKTHPHWELRMTGALKMVVGCLMLLLL